MKTKILDKALRTYADYEMFAESVYIEIKSTARDLAKRHEPSSEYEKNKKEIISNIVNFQKIIKYDIDVLDPLNPEMTEKFKILSKTLEEFEDALKNKPTEIEKYASLNDNPKLDQAIGELKCVNFLRIRIADILHVIKEKKI